MQVKVFPIGRLMANCSVLFSDSGTAVVIDPGGDPAPVVSFMEEKGLTCAAILLTHGHDDHTEGAEALKEKTSAPLYIGRGDAYRLDEPADVLLDGGEQLEFGDIRIEVIPAPGHTEGGMCFLTGGALFSGDTLFRESVGRTDLPGGNWKTLEATLASLKERFAGSSVTVIPGHGPMTDFAYETEHNYYL